MSLPIIEVENLSKKYRLGVVGATTLREDIGRLARRLRGEPVDEPSEFWALRDVSFSVQAGEVVGIIGRNGAGKSTLLKILSRITEPTAGRAILRGRIASLLEVGTGFHPDLTGRENVYLNGAILGMSRTEIAARFDEIVEFAGVEKFIDTPVKHYSSGMRVRLAFAVAAHLESEVLIVDEVLAVGDAEFQKKCLGVMQMISSRQHRTILFVSHQIGAMRSLCRQAIWLQSGRVHMTGPIHGVVDSYLEGSGLASPNHIEIPSGDDDAAIELSRLTFNSGKKMTHGEPLRIDIHFNTRRPVSALSVAIGFSDTEGARLLTLDSDAGGKARPDFPRECTGTATLQLDLMPLPPGRYYIDLGARTGDNHSLCYHPSCAMVEVVPGSATPVFLVRNAHGVFLHPHSSWQVEAR